MENEKHCYYSMHAFQEFVYSQNSQMKRPMISVLIAPIIGISSHVEELRLCVHFLGQPLHAPAYTFVHLLGNMHKDFVESRVFKPWTPGFALTLTAMPCPK